MNLSTYFTREKFAVNRPVICHMSFVYFLVQWFATETMRQLEKITLLSVYKYCIAEPFNNKMCLFYIRTQGILGSNHSPLWLFKTNLQIKNNVRTI